MIRECDLMGAGGWGGAGVVAAGKDWHVGSPVWCGVWFYSGAADGLISLLWDDM